MEGGIKVRTHKTMNPQLADPNAQLHRQGRGPSVSKILNIFRPSRFSNSVFSIGSQLQAYIDTVKGEKYSFRFLLVTTTTDRT